MEWVFRVILACLVCGVTVTSGAAFAMESGTNIPSGGTVIYSGASGSSQTVAYYYDDSGQYYRSVRNNATGETETETRFNNLTSLRTSILGVDDQTGIMGSGQWSVDSDGDGYSNMLEILTNGDPFSALVVPSEPRILQFDGGESFVPLLPVADMESDTGDNTTETSNRKVEEYLARQEEILVSALTVFAFVCGLVMWRLALLSKSQRDIF